MPGPAPVLIAERPPPPVVVGGSPLTHLFLLPPSLSSLILCLLLLFLRGGKLLIPAVLISGDLRRKRKGLFLLDPFSLWLHLANNSSGRRRKKESNYFVGSFFSYLEDTRCACDKGRESFFKWPDEPCLSSSSLRPRCNVRKRTEFFELRVTLAHTTKVFLSLFTFLEYLTNAFQSLHTFLRNSGEYPYSSPDSFCRPPLPMQAVLASPQERKRMKANCCKWEKRRRKPDGLPPSLPPPSVPPRLCLMFKERRECMVRCCSPYFSPPPLWSVGLFSPFSSAPLQLAPASQFRFSRRRHNQLPSPPPPLFVRSLSGGFFRGGVPRLDISTRGRRGKIGWATRGPPALEGPAVQIETAL